MSFGRAAPRAILFIGLLTTGCLAIQRLLQPLTRVRIERDFYRAVIEALLETDVVAATREQNQRVVFEGSARAIDLVGTLVPALVTDVLVTIVVIPILLASFPVRVLGTAAIAMVVVGATMLVVRRIANRGEQELIDAFDEVADLLLVASDARLEIVARGAERAFAARFAEISKHYVRRSTRVRFAAAWIGRAPLLAGALVIGGVAVVDPSSRAELSTTLLTQALALAACLPAILGTVVGVQSTLRTAAHARPFATLLDATRRPAASERAAPPMPVRFEVDALAFRYEIGEPWVFSGVSFVWNVAHPLALVGENGSGKSTLLRLLIGLRPPTSGSIRVDGVDLSDFDLTDFRRRVSFLPQRPYLGQPHGSVRAALHMVVPDAPVERIEHALAKTGLLHALRHHGGDPLEVTVGTLSAGQRQRLALARILLQNAPIVVLDEPDANLDHDGVLLLGQLVKELSAAGKMVAIAAHSPELANVSPSPVVLASAEASRRSA